MTKEQFVARLEEILWELHDSYLELPSDLAEPLANELIKAGFVNPETLTEKR